jgi:hypothetical protein
MKDVSTSVTALPPGPHAVLAAKVSTSQGVIREGANGRGRCRVNTSGRAREGRCRRVREGTRSRARLTLAGVEFRTKSEPILP